MRSTVTRSLFILVLAALVVSGQQKAPDSGVSAEWDIRQTIAAISAHSARLKSFLDQLQPREWVANKGAPEEYVTQWNTTRRHADQIVLSTENLNREPERVTAALDTMFRLQASEVLLGSLLEGVRKYQNPALADLLNAIMQENGNNRTRLQQYVLELASTKEQEFKVVDQEAQRCRGVLSKQPPPIRRSERK